MREKNDFWLRERECERLFEEGAPYYMITTENLDWLLYRNDEEFRAGTNLTAIASGTSGFTILDDIQMNNHHHMMGHGTPSQVEAFVRIFHEKGIRLQRSFGNPSLKKWDIRIDETTDLRQFRNRIGYIDRNAYVARLDSTPTGYPWGGGHLMFNGNLWQMNPGIPFKELTIDERRIICRSHNIDMPESFRVLNRTILRSSFIDYHWTESLFNSANQYFSFLTKRGETDIEIARLLGEHIQLPNEEVYQIVSGWYPGESLRQWDVAKRLEAAQRMKRALGASNKQISQILRLPLEQIDRVFPRPQ